MRSLDEIRRRVWLVHHLKPKVEVSHENGKLVVDKLLVLEKRIQRQTFTAGWKFLEIFRKIIFS